MSDTKIIKNLLNAVALGTTYAAEKAAPSLAGKALIAVGLQSTPFLVTAAPYILGGITLAKIGVAAYEAVTK